MPKTLLRMKSNLFPPDRRHQIKLLHIRQGYYIINPVQHRMVIWSLGFGLDEFGPLWRVTGRDKLRSIFSPAGIIERGG